jgi:hypothetical protein
MNILKVKLVRFYLYVYLDLEKPGIYNIDTSLGEFTFNHTPVYIGKGADKGIEYHQAESCRNQRLKEKIKEGTYECYIIKKELPSHLAYYLESELIYKIGRININSGPLFNETGGVNLIEADKYAEIGPLHLEFNKLILILKMLNTSKNLRQAAQKLEISERSVYRYIKGYRLEKSSTGWYQLNT